MKALIVGADVLGRIPDVLAAHDIEIIGHVTGRNRSQQRKIGSLPIQAEMVVLFTDFLGHNVMRRYRDLAEAGNIPFIACKRSVCALKQVLENRQTM
ncbi:DUF2325 domain-containing protein [Chitinivorax sp. B]|uniref:DUF2325 domain-containing protein n=1 Tax=Chitinivorax sp. B TaxID=2502235 RepID=UPI0014855CFC|nr:DUF2325 domain-containing protein [Chitinivorax sp. B]